jgi:1-acyl-sn-glycerol-3-phosphate acyltransferase
MGRWSGAMAGSTSTLDAPIGHGSRRPYAGRVVGWALGCLVASGVCFWVSLLRCYLLVPTDWSRHGISHYGNFMASIGPYSAGLLLSSLFMACGADALPEADPRFATDTRLLKTIAGLLVVILVTPTRSGAIVTSLHIAGSSALFICQLVLGLHLYLTVSPSRLITGLIGVQLTGSLLTLMSVCDMLHVMFVGQISAELAFTLLGIVGTARMFSDEAETITRSHPLIRRTLKALFRCVFTLLTRTEVRGLKHVPHSGPLIFAGNHLSPIDSVLSGIHVPWPIEPLALTDLFLVPGTGTLLRLYGVIPVNRDAHDGVAMALALEALAQGKIVGILPEGRVSVTGGLERARTGVAYLALASGVPVVPAAVTGTERALADLRRLRLPRLTLTFGEPLHFGREDLAGPGRHARLREVADQIMYRIAAMLPPHYRGVYSVIPPAGGGARHSAAAIASNTPGDDTSYSTRHTATASFE